LIDGQFMLELEKILWKISRSTLAEAEFTQRELMIIETLRHSRESVLAHLQTIMREHRGLNPRGEEKLRNIYRGIEKICG